MTDLSVIAAKVEELVMSTLKSLDTVNYVPIGAGAVAVYYLFSSFVSWFRLRHVPGPVPRLRLAFMADEKQLARDLQLSAAGSQEIRLGCACGAELRPYG